MNRRDFLRTIGLTSLGLTSSSLFLPSLARHAHADELGPQRLIVMFTQHGHYWPGWRMRPGSVSDASAYTLDLPKLARGDFSRSLAPLFPIRDKVTIVDGLALVSAEDDTTGLRHEIGQVHALTGASATMVSGQPFGGAPSIDQRVAAHIGRPDRFRSVEIGVGEPPASINFRGNLEMLPSERSPLRLYRRLFGLDDSGATDALLTNQGSLLDQVSRRYDALSDGLSEEDRRRLAAHKNLVRGIEQRMNGLASLECARPAAPGGYDAGYDQNFDDFVKLAMVALSCDLTRVLTFHMGQMSLEQVTGRVGNLHDEHAHAIYDDKKAADVMSDYSALHAGHFARLVNELAAVPEGSGTMLDNTLCVWVSELADGVHSFERWGAVVAGGRRMNLGKYLYQPSDVPYEGWGWSGTLRSMARPHQTFLTSVAQNFGVDVDGMPVREILGKRNTRIDCTGVVPGLLG